MAECIKCRSFQFCPWATPPDIICSSFKPRTQTNADRLRAMSDEELAQFFGNMVDCDTCPLDGKMGTCPLGCEATWGRWLKQEAEDDGKC